MPPPNGSGACSQRICSDHQRGNGRQAARVVLPRQGKMTLVFVSFPQENFLRKFFQKIFSENFSRKFSQKFFSEKKRFFFGGGGGGE
jgi:hypothetical protein